MDDCIYLNSYCNITLLALLGKGTLHTLIVVYSECSIDQERIMRKGERGEERDTTMHLIKI